MAASLFASKSLTHCFKAARHLALSVAMVSHWSTFMPQCFTLCFKVSLKRFLCPPRWRTPSRSSPWRSGLVYARDKYATRARPISIAMRSATSRCLCFDCALAHRRQLFDRATATLSWAVCVGAACGNYRGLWYAACSRSSFASVEQVGENCWLIHLQFSLQPYAFLISHSAIPPIKWRPGLGNTVLNLLVNMARHKA